MELSAAHLRYLLAIYQTAHTQRDVSSRTIAERLGVTRPSVARALGQLMDRGMIVKAHYGKIYLTDRASLWPGGCSSSWTACWSTSLPWPWN